MRGRAGTARLQEKADAMSFAEFAEHRLVLRRERVENPQHQNVRRILAVADSQFDLRHAIADGQAAYQLAQTGQ